MKLSETCIFLASSLLLVYNLHIHVLALYYMYLEPWAGLKPERLWEFKDQHCILANILELVWNLYILMS